jgi:hypothetical protein
MRPRRRKLASKRGNNLMIHGFAPLLAALALQSAMRSAMRPWSVAVWLSVALALAGSPALAADTGNGSKNFATPSSVPNYFSNEAGPMLGGAAESQRGSLYSSQTASLPRQQETTPASRPETRPIASAHGRSHAASRKTADRHLASHARAHGHVASHVASRHAAETHSKHAANRPTHVGSPHHQLHG